MTINTLLFNTVSAPEIPSPVIGFSTRPSMVTFLPNFVQEMKPLIMQINSTILVFMNIFILV